MTDEKRPRIVLLVDDTAWDREQLATELRRCPVELVQFGDALAALTWLHDGGARRVALVVADERMPGPSGSDLLEEVGRLWPSVRRVLLSAYVEPSWIMDSPYLVIEKGTAPRAVIADEICRLACKGM
jgi:DNA-binding NarL/FixJ family response regulator